MNQGRDGRRKTEGDRACGMRALRRVLAFAALAVLTLLPSSVFRPLYAQSNLTISILTWGPGDYVFERFGHNALRVQDSATGLDLAYNWGMFDFDQPNFLGRFLSGDTKYWVEAFPTQRLVDFYAGMDRESIEQVLKSHGIGLSGLDSSDRQLASLQAESSLLRAAVANKNNQQVSLS